MKLLKSSLAFTLSISHSSPSSSETWPELGLLCIPGIFLHSCMLVSANGLEQSLVLRVSNQYRVLILHPAFLF